MRQPHLHRFLGTEIAVTGPKGGPLTEDYDRTEMPGSKIQLTFRLRFPDNSRIGPFPAQTLIDLYAGGRVPEGAFVRREPDGAWLPFHATFRNVLPPRRAKSEPKTVDRRVNREFTLINRRRGRGWMFTEIALCASLFSGLLFFVLR